MQHGEEMPTHQAVDREQRQRDRQHREANKIVMQLAETDHVNSGICISFMLGVRIFKIVTTKLIPVAKLPIPLSLLRDSLMLMRAVANRQQT
jgi:hypothetical protein